MVHERSASQSVRRIARAADRDRRVSAAIGRLTRLAPSAAAATCLAALAAAAFGGPRWLGPILLGAMAVAAAFTLIAARRDRPVSDAGVAGLDRAAGLGGALRSAHWFADPDRASAGDGADPDWVAFHVDAAAARIDRVDWQQVFARPRARGPWVATIALAVVAGVVSFLPWSPRIPASSVGANPSRPAAGEAPSLPPALVPTIVEGMRAMKAGQPPSRDALKAIGQALDIAMQDEAAQTQIEGLFAQVGGEDVDPSWLDPHYDPREEQYIRGSQMAALQWAYREAAGRASADDRTGRDARRDSTAADAAGDSKAALREAETTGSGDSPGSPVQADVHGQAASFTSVLFGSQQATGDAARRAAAESASRAGTMAALRQEVVHASADVTGTQTHGGATRKATNSGRDGRAAQAYPTGVSYDRARATQALAVPEARRSLVHDFFLRPSMPR